MSPAPITDGPSRRTALALLAASGLPAIGAALAQPAPALAAGVRTDLVTVLYRKESPEAPSRLDPAVQAATLALEAAFLEQGLRVIQPTPEAYRVLDQGQAVIVTFAPDAGFTLVFSALKAMRAMSGADAGIAEVRLEARVFVGREILVADDGRGQMMTRLDADNREFGERRAYELAARRAAAELVDKAAPRLKALSAEKIAAMTQPLPQATPMAQSVPVPAQPPQPVSVADGPLPAPARRYAILVGVADYSVTRARLHLGSGELKDLPGVTRDIGNVDQALRTLGFPADNISALRDAGATGSALRNALKKLVGVCQPDDLVLIFISAHGGNRQFGPSGFGMPILNDFDPGNPDLLDFWELQSLVGNLPARRSLLVVDTCHSGGATQWMPTVVVAASGASTSTGTVAPNVAGMAQAVGASRHFAILSASQAQEISWEDGANGGLFTSRLLRGLLATKGSEAIETVFQRYVQNEVMDESRRICQRARACADNPVQTPVLAYSGRGNHIRL